MKFGTKDSDGRDGALNDKGSGTGTQTGRFAGLTADTKDRKRRQLPDSNRFNRNPGRNRGRK